MVTEKEAEGKNCVNIDLGLICNTEACGRGREIGFSGLWRIMTAN